MSAEADRLALPPRFVRPSNEPDGAAQRAVERARALARVRRTEPATPTFDVEDVRRITRVWARCPPEPREDDDPSPSAVCAWAATVAHLRPHDVWRFLPVEVRRAVRRQGCGQRVDCCEREAVER